MVTRVVTLDVDRWRPQVVAADTARWARELESGAVLALPRLAFGLTAEETRFLDSRWSDGRSKNISVDGDSLHGAAGNPGDIAALARMIGRFAADASALVAALFPRYAPWVIRARTSYRPHGAAGRATSWRKDDTRLHVDAFPSRPTRGRRILRVFCNVNPGGEDRVWRLGEPFEAVARQFLPSVRPMVPGEATLLSALHITRGRRSEYDHLMLSLHDRAKANLHYQRNSPQREVRFAPGTTWICYSDQVMHAAISGQYMLEQTTQLPLAALYDQCSSPLAILERLRGRALAPRLEASSADDSHARSATGR